MKMKSLVIHPFLLAVYPVLFLYSHNLGEVPVQEIFLPIVVILGFTISVWSILRIILKNWKKPGIIVSLFLALFFSYGYIITPLEGKRLILLMNSVWILLFTLGSFFIIRSNKDFARATVILNIAVSILVVQPMLNIVIHQFRSAGQSGYDNHIISVQTDSQSTVQKESYPDIYFIILDAYAREDILREMYNFDNSEFLNFLGNRGFYIADRSASNYCKTGLFLGSCFNLSYLDKAVKKIGQYNKSRKPLGIIIRKSFVLTYLKKHGYEIVAFSSGKLETELNTADVYLKRGTSMSMFHSALKNMTPLPDIMAFRKNYNEFDIHRQNILYMLDNLGRVANSFQSPKFVFAHIEAPHPPFVFGPNGEPRNLETRFNDHDGDWLIRPGRLSLEEYRRYYRDQIIFLNSRMEEVVDLILKNSKQPPIIMIIADHGPRSEMVWEDPNKTNMQECLSILNACYLPNNGEKLLYPEITPVNSFRIIFNYYFGEHFKLLPDKCYFSTATYLYKFYDMTERVQK